MNSGVANLAELNVPWGLRGNITANQTFFSA